MLALEDSAQVPALSAESPHPRTRRRGPKLQKDEVEQIRLALKAPNARVVEIAKQFGLVRQSVHNIKNGASHMGRPLGRPRKVRSVVEVKA